VGLIYTTVFNPVFKNQIGSIMNDNEKVKAITFLTENEMKTKKMSI
jgi:hypothetical protein